MRKLLILLVFTLVLAGTNASAMTIKNGDDTIEVYGSVRAFTVFNHVDKSDVMAFSTDQFVIGLQSNSRAGVRWTRGNFFVNSEWGMAARDSNANNNVNVTLRYMYGQYTFDNGGKFRFGQIPGISYSDGPFDRKLSADNGLQGFGTISDVRRVGINYEINGFSISALSMRQDAGNVTNANVLGGTFRELMPRIEAAYEVSSVRIGGSFVTSTSYIPSVDASGKAERKSNNVSAGHIAVSANPKIADNTRFLVSGFYGVNSGLYDMGSLAIAEDYNEAISRSNRILPRQKEGPGKLDNTKAFGAAVGFLVDKFEAGFGIQSSSNDQWEENINGMGFYANYKYRVSNFRITPEVGYINTGKNTGSGGIPKGATEKTNGIWALQFGLQFRMDI